MRALEKIKRNIAEEINKTLGGNIAQASDFVYPPNPEFGDLSLPCFGLFKAMKEKGISAASPAEAASWLVGKMEIGSEASAASSVKAAGPYLNFVLDKERLTKEVLAEIGKEKEKYGTSGAGKGRKAVIEYSNANTHKEYHIGHLRNVCYGDAVTKILAANGYEAIPVSYINDFGIHVAKTLWAYEEFFKNEKLPANKGRFLGRVYARAARELENNEAAKRLVAGIMKKIESRKGREYELWRETRKWSIAQFDKIYEELGVKFDHIFYESEIIKKGMELVAKAYERRILTKSDGAVIADLNEYGLGVLVFLRADGTALYPVADLALAEEKRKKYGKHISIYVVDIRQSQYFKQLFKVLELLGGEREMKHLGYEFVKLPSGMMSSRTGNVVSYEDLRERLAARAEQETKKRHPDWSDRKIREATAAIVNGALKFEMLKVSAGQVIAFDADKALRFEGYTAAYLQYTYARIRSIIRKSSKLKIQSSKFKAQNLKEPKEYGIVMKLAKYPDVVSRAGENCDPSEIAKYLFELARDFNDYYHSVPVLKAEKEIMKARLDLINAAARVIENGLGLLGIAAPEEM